MSARSSGGSSWRKSTSTRSSSRVPPRCFGDASGRAERLLAFHPIVLGDQVLVCDGSRVLAYNLNDRPGGPDGSDGRPVSPAWKHDSDNGASAPQASRPDSAIPRYTLTALGHRIYARMGTVSTMFPLGGGFGGRRGFQMGEIGTSSIVALDWNAEGRILWEVKSVDLVLPNRPGGSRSVNFEGTPIADAQNVYVAVTDRRDEIRIYVGVLRGRDGHPAMDQRPGDRQAGTRPGHGLQRR